MRGSKAAQELFVTLQASHTPIEIEDLLSVDREFLDLGILR